MANLNITVTKNKVFIGDDYWGKKPNKMNLGDYLLNLLYYKNKEGINTYSITVDGKKETSAFKKQVKEKYINIPNTELRNSFFTYANIK